MTTTPTARIQRITADFRRRLRSHDAAAAKTLESAYRSTLARITPHLDALYKQIEEKQQAGQAVPLSWLYEEQRLQHLKSWISVQIDLYSHAARSVTAQSQQSAAVLGSASAQAQMKALTPPGVDWTWGRPSPDAIVNLVSAAQPGSPLYDLFAEFGPDAAKAAGQALITGVTLGQGPREIAKAVADSLDMTRSRALTTARTETMRAYRSAARDNYRANDDVVEGWLWMSALSKNTCAACIAMHGTKHSLDEEMESHPCCECTPVPLTKSWDDILSPLGIDSSDIEETRIDMQSGADWFDSQDADVQKAILGNAKYDAWNNGDFTLDDIVGYSHSADWGRSIREKSLKELKA